MSRTVSLGNAFYGHRLHYLLQKPSSTRIDLALQDPQTSRRAILDLNVPLTLNGVLTVRTKHVTSAWVGSAFASVCLMAMRSHSYNCVLDFASSSLLLVTSAITTSLCRTHRI
jgi:hypothetical protein